MRRIIISFLGSAAFLVSCSSPGENVVLYPSFTSIPSLTPTPEHSLPSTQEPQIHLEVVSVSPTAPPLPSTPTPSPLPPRSSLAVGPPAQGPQSVVCSPLADHTLEQLPEIVSQPYDPPPPGKDERHHGVDFAYYNHAGRASIEGEGVQAIMDGRVAAAIPDRLPYGNMVIIETAYEHIPEQVLNVIDIPQGNSLYHLYAHFTETPLVALDQQVKCGQLLGYVGQTGYVVPVAHLHLETRLGPPNVSFESMVFFDTQASAEERAAYTRWRTSGDFQHIDPIIIISGFIESFP